MEVLSTFKSIRNFVLNDKVHYDMIFVEFIYMFS
jgi:hypothetical protein